MDIAKNQKEEEDNEQQIKNEQKHYYSYNPWNKLPSNNPSNTVSRLPMMHKLPLNNQINLPNSKKLYDDFKSNF